MFSEIICFDKYEQFNIIDEIVFLNISSKSKFLKTFTS